MKMTIEQLAKEERRAYFRKWRAANRDKVRKHQQDYWERKVKRKLDGNGNKEGI